MADVANTCGSTFEERLNPSDTGNVRMQSRFTLADGLVLTIDPSFQWVKANGGGTVVAQEGLRDVNPAGGTATPNQCVSAAPPANSSCQVGYLARHTLFRPRPQRRRRPARYRARPRAEHRRGPIAGASAASLRYDIDDGRRRSASLTRSIAAVTARPARPVSSSSTASPSTPSRTSTRSSPSTAISSRSATAFRSLSFTRSRASIAASSWIGRLTDEPRRPRALLLARPHQQLRDLQRQRLRRMLRRQYGRPHRLSSSSITVNDRRWRAQPPQGPQHREFPLQHDPAQRRRDLRHRAAHQHLCQLFARRCRCRAPTIFTTTSSSRRPIPSATPKSETTDNFDVGVRYRSSKRPGPGYRAGTRSSRTGSPRLTIRSRRSRSSAISAGRQIWHRRKHLLSGRSRSCNSTSTAPICGRTFRTMLPESAPAASGVELLPVQRNCPSGLRLRPDHCRDRSANRARRSIRSAHASRPSLGPLELTAEAKRTGPRYVDDEICRSLCTTARAATATLTRSIATPNADFQVYGARTSRLRRRRHRRPLAARLRGPQRRHLLPVQRDQCVRHNSTSATSAASC